ncbi:alpha-mannosidase [Brachybacterium phenoliresistens]|uniref:Alpha-mannosidase n=1 Tax=Brachybacterium phenoliresistens TaxID=396014 RepID=Z9JWR7_9MICO|nr:GH92 family glycosyl hydrolase [Brachybacterium phenoliresistens]EWS82227.1 alpha-mannosidase [Brachybacterium phenoliresistens]
MFVTAQTSSHGATGPIGSPTSKDGAGFLSPAALRYAFAPGEEARAPLPVLPGLEDLAGRTVQPGDVLRTFVFPDLDENLTWGATHVAVDLVFEDGSRLSELDPRDQYGTLATARGMGEGKILYADQWNDVQVSLEAAAGRTIAEVQLAVQAPGSVIAGTDTVTGVGAGEIPLSVSGTDDRPEAARAVELTGWIDGPYLGPAPADPPREDPVAWVDTRRGTYASRDFSRGNTLPLTAWPNGFAFFTPMTDARTRRWVYEYHRRGGDDNRSRLQGLGISHQPSPWMGDRGQFLLMPLAATPSGQAPDASPEGRAAGFDHAREIARPDVYQVSLDGGTHLRLAPTDHGALVEIGLPSGPGEPHLLFEGIDEHSRVDASGAVLDGTLQAWVDSGPEQGYARAEGSTRMFVHAQIAPLPIGAGPAEGATPGAGVLTFPEGTEVVTVRMVTSYIGMEQARHTFDLELAGRRFEEVREAAHAAWTQRLSVIEVEGASAPQLRTLYGNLYRLNLYPNSHWENAGTAEDPAPVHASPVLPPRGPLTSTETDAQVVLGTMYVNNGFWDTYRTAWPAYALLYPQLAAELADGFVQQFREGGWIARWSSPGYADCMTGTSSDVAFADLALKGVDLPDPLAAFDSGLRNATVAPPFPEVGRKGNERAVFTGYVDTDTPESVSWALEAHINDAGLAALGELLQGDARLDSRRRAEVAEEAAYLRARSANYALLFDEAIGFFQGRRPDGSFARSAEDFDPCEWGGDFTETDGWNFAFHVPHDGEGLAALYGGREKLREKLEEFFATPENADLKGTYEDAIHEMDEARAVRMGQFGVSNQPAHHIPFLFHHAGAPHRAMEIVREVQQRLFVGEQIGQGYPGDEDNGEMSAWWLLTALGLYPLQLDAARYHLVAPLFPEARVRPLGGEPFTVIAEGEDVPAPYVAGLTVAGREHEVAALDHADLRGELRFTLSPTPSTWGAVPPSATAPGEHPEPLVDLLPPDPEDPLRDDDSRTELHLPAPGSEPGAVQHGIVVSEAGELVIDLVSFDEPVDARFLTLTSGAEEGGDPVAWRLEISDDRETWAVLDERAGQEFRWRRQTRPFLLHEPRPAMHYRLVITESNGPLVLAGVELLF